MKKILVLLLMGISSIGFSQSLFKAVEKGDLEKVKKVIEEGENVNAYSEKGLFPLWRAAADNNYEMSELLINNGADVNQSINVPPGNSTAIELPCQEGYLNIIKLLVDNDAEVNIKGYHDFTPIRIAARNGHVQIVKYLAQHGAEIDFRALDGATPLEHAASKGHYEIVQFLIEKGANINNKDNDGDFALGEAAKRGYIEIIELLLANGADTKMENKENKNAFDLAKERGQKKSVEIIKAAMTK